MKLELKHKVLDEDLIEELDFNHYLDLFNHDIPLIPQRILHPLTTEQGIRHFQELKTVCQTFSAQQVGELLEQARQLPYLENIFIHLEHKSIETAHLYLLLQFLGNNKQLCALEASLLPLANEISPLDEMAEIIAAHTLKNGRKIKLGEEEQELFSKIEELERTLGQEIIQFENELALATHLRMVYPYPKELPKNYPQLALLQECPLVHLEERGESYLVHARLPEALEARQKERTGLLSTFNALMNHRLDEINRTLHPLHKDFIRYYYERKERTYLYALAHTAHTYRLQLPQLMQENAIFKIAHAALPSLRESKEQNYVPLHVQFGGGTNVIFGANMSGKTTMLKTLFFQLWLVKLGLPVPAKEFITPFPALIAMHLKTSGNTKQNLSSFGEELAFFCQTFPENSFVFVDELFQTTNPVSGTELSKIFLREFADKKVIFICTTQYPEVLKLDNIALFKTKECSWRTANSPDATRPVKELLESNTYELEAITKENLDQALRECRTPLHIALHFPLSESLKERIKIQLAELES